MLILAGLVRHAAPGLPAGVVRVRVRWASVALGLICADLFAAGVVKGLLRWGDGAGDPRPVLPLVLAPLPLFGLMLGAALLSLSWRIARASARPRPWRVPVRRTTHHAPAESTARGRPAPAAPAGVGP
jgi:hypothetical protein